MTTTVICSTPNGREIRKREDGTYEVQPHNDNYWLQCRSVAEAMFRYHYPSGLPSATQFAEMIVQSWDSQWSIDETVRLGVSDDDVKSAAECAECDEALGFAIVAEIERICRERQS